MTVAPKQPDDLTTVLGDIFNSEPEATAPSLRPPVGPVEQSDDNRRMVSFHASGAAISADGDGNLLVTVQFSDELLFLAALERFRAANRSSSRVARL